MKLDKLNLVELDNQELRSIDGGRRGRGRGRRGKRNNGADEIISGLVTAVETIGDFFNVSSIQGEDTGTSHTAAKVAAAPTWSR